MPHKYNEKMFDNASIDVIVFRYCKNSLIEKKVLYNDKLLYITNSNGLITFGEEKNNNNIMFQDYFDIYVGLVSGKEEVYKNEELGNIEVVNGEDKVDKYIYIENKKLLLRLWQPGDKFRPLGMNGNQKISDFLINNKVNIFDKDQQAVLTADDQIIWVCGYRIDDSVRIIGSTKNIIRIL